MTEWLFRDDGELNIAGVFGSRVDCVDRSVVVTGVVLVRQPVSDSVMRLNVDADALAFANPADVGNQRDFDRHDLTFREGCVVRLQVSVLGLIVRRMLGVEFAVGDLEPALGERETPVTWGSDSVDAGSTRGLPIGAHGANVTCAE